MRDAGHHGIEDLPGSGAFFGGDVEYFIFAEAEHLLDFAGHPIGLGLRQVYLVHHRNQFQVVVHCQQSIGDGLGLNSLAGVHHQQGALGGGHSP